VCVLRNLIPQTTYTTPAKEYPYSIDDGINVTLDVNLYLKLKKYYSK